MTISITVEDAAEETRLVVNDALIAFNRAKANRPEPVWFHVMLRDAHKRIRGGAVARLHFDVLFLDNLWIDEDLRGTGLGRALMAKYEEHGRSLGARTAWLDTMSWQARPFYEKVGYTVFGELPYANGAHTQFFMRKTL
jgi:GNAT superfamily N-acetyltransferase